MNIKKIIYHIIWLGIILTLFILAGQLENGILAVLTIIVLINYIAFMTPISKLTYAIIKTGDNK